VIPLPTSDAKQPAGSAPTGELLVSPASAGGAGLLCYSAFFDAAL